MYYSVFCILFDRGTLSIRCSNSGIISMSSMCSFDSSTLCIKCSVSSSIRCSSGSISSINCSISTWVRDEQLADVVDDSVGSQLVFLGDDGLPVQSNLVSVAADLQHGALQSLHRSPRHDRLRALHVLQDVVVQQVCGGADRYASGPTSESSSSSLQYKYNKQKSANAHLSEPRGLPRSCSGSPGESSRRPRWWERRWCTDPRSPTWWSNLQQPSPSETQRQSTGSQEVNEKRNFYRSSPLLMRLWVTLIDYWTLTRSVSRSSSMSMSVCTLLEMAVMTRSTTCTMPLVACWSGLIRRAQFTVTIWGGEEGIC